MIGMPRTVPVILQSESSECGLAALCMIAGYHGHELNLIRARQRFSLSLKGSTVADIIRMAEAIGLTARAYSLDLHEIERLQTPAILHWQMNHFVVLARCNRRGVEIHDPALGKRFVPHREFAEKFTGVAVEFTPAANFSRRRETERPRLRTLLGSVHGLGRVVGELFALSLLLQIAALALPYVFQLIVDGVLTQRNEHLLVAICTGLTFMILFQTATSAVRQWCISVVGSRLAYQLTSNIMAHLVRLPLSYFEKRHTGDILMRFNSVQALQSALTSTMVSALVDALVVALTVIVLFVYDTTLAWIVLLFSLTILLLRLLCFPYQRRLQETAISKEASEQTLNIETLRSVQSLRTVGGEPFRLQRWSAAFAEVVNARLALARFGIHMNTAEQLLEGGQHILVIYLAASSILDGNGALTLGALFAFLSYKAQFADHAGSLVNHIISFKLLDLHLQRLADILWQKRDVSDKRLLTSEPPAGDIRVSGLGFRYAQFDTQVLRDISFTVPEGRMVAIIGPSGAGKTTLLKLLLGLYWPSDGSIHIGDLRLDRHNAPLWRQSAGAVLQEDQLISGSIADNIAFLEEKPDMQRIEQAAARAGIAEEIARHPMGYLSLVGDLGSSLSSGQKQRLLIARALYREPAVLLLDEGTANLDEANEARLAALVGGLCITRIVVAHRPALVHQADIVLRLDRNGLTDVTAQWQTTNHPQASASAG